MDPQDSDPEAEYMDMLSVAFWKSYGAELISDVCRWEVLFMKNLIWPLVLGLIIGSLVTAFEYLYASSSLCGGPTQNFVFGLSLCSGEKYLFFILFFLHKFYSLQKFVEFEKQISFPFLLNGFVLTFQALSPV